MSGAKAAAWRKRLARTLRWAALGLGALALLLVLAFVGVLTYVQTPSGAARLLRLGLDAANSAISGRVEAEGASVQGSRIVVRGARLLDAEGARVASFERVEVDLVWAALFRGHLEARWLHLTRPFFSLVLDEEGSNVERTFSARRPGPPQAGGQPAPLTFVVHRFEVEQGEARVQTPKGPPFVSKSLALQGSGRYALRSGDFQLEARGTGDVEQPTASPLSLSLRGEGRGPALSAEVDVHGAGANVVADLRHGGDLLLEGHFALDVTANLARALVPGWPLRVPLAVTGQTRREGTSYRVLVQAAAGRARLELRTQVDVAELTARHVRLEVQHVHLAELFGRGPDSDLELQAQGTVRGSSFAEASGSLALLVPPSAIRGVQVGPVEVAATLQGGRLEVSSLRAVLPGLGLEGSGQGTRHSMQGRLHLEVTNLAALEETLGDALGGLPPLGGRGSLRLEVSGHPTHPGLEAEGHFTALAVGPSSAEDVHLVLQAKDVARPLDSNLTLDAHGLTLAGRSFRDVKATLHSEARAVAFRLTAAGPVQLELAGTADADGRGLLLDSLLVRFPEEAWSLAAPARVRLEEARLQTERLELVSGSQSVALSARLVDQHLEGALEVSNLDLAHLPRLLLPGTAHLEGRLDASVEVHGDERHPDLAFRVQLAHGGYHGLSGLSAHLSGGRRAGHLTLDAQVEGLGTAVELEADGPELALTRRLHEPLSLHLLADEVDVGQAVCALAEARLLAGGCPGGTAFLSARARLEVRVDGFADGPSVHLRLRASDVRTGGLPPAEGALSLEGDDTTPVALHFEGKALRGALEAQASLAATTRELLARRHSWAGWRTLPLRAEVNASGLALGLLHDAGWVSPSVEGVATLQLSASGTLAEPRGKASVEVEKLVLLSWPQVDARLSVEAADTLAATLTLQGPGEAKGSVHLAVGAPLGQVLASTSPEELAQASVALEGELGSFAFRDLPLNVNRLRRDRRLVDGQLSLSFQGRGTLLAPIGTATLTAKGLGPTDGARFEGTAHARYAESKAEVDAELLSTGGGTLHLDGSVQLDLSLPGLRRGLTLGEAPLAAKLHSVRFEPDFVATLFPWMRSISGKLQVEGEASGTLGRPVLHGALSWADGSMGVVGFGLYQDIQLRASASNAGFTIEELSAKVQGGTLSLHLHGERAAEGFTLSGALRTKDLPFVFDDQLWCIATLQGKLSGSLRPGLLDVAHLSLSEAELELPEARRKRLQDLSSPKDVVLTRRGVAVASGNALFALAASRSRSRGEAGAQTGDVFLRLGLEAPNSVWVRGKDVTLELGLSKPFQLALGEKADVSGEVSILQGRGDVWGRRFEVQSGGWVHFSGAPDKARLDVTGVYSSPQSQAKVSMHLSGEVSDVKLTPSSEPPMTEAEIYTLLATGRTQLVQSSLGSSTSVGGANTGASILGSWAATELKKAVGGAVPIDVLSVEVNNDERGINQTRLEAGKYLSDDVYIGYQARINADPFRYQNANAIRVEYRILRRWSLQLEYGDANAGSLDAVWSHDY